MSAPNHRDSVHQQYITDEALRIQQEINDKYTVPATNHVEWVLSNMLWQGTETVLDLGAASGTYHDVLLRWHPDITYYGLDYSPGMLNQHPGKRLVLADAQTIPYTDDSFDVVMANDMLYHLQDIPSAIQEIRRVMRPGGTLLAATSSSQTMPQLQVLMRRAILLLARSGASQIQPPPHASDRFSLEAGTRQLARHFYAVRRADLPTQMVFPEIDPLMEYLESTRALREPQLPEGVQWEDVMMIMRQQVSHLINHLGELVINKITGVLLATDSGDFIKQFTEIKAQSEAAD